MLPRQRVKTVTHAVELLNFMQDRIRMHGYAAFLRTLTREHFMWTDLVQDLKEDSRDYFHSNPQRHRLGAAWPSVHPVTALAAPTRVSPAPATEQKYHQKNNQYGFHVHLTC